MNCKFSFCSKLLPPGLEFCNKRCKEFHANTLKKCRFCGLKNHINTATYKFYCCEDPGCLILFRTRLNSEISELKKQLKDEEERSDYYKEKCFNTREELEERADKGRKRARVSEQVVYLQPPAQQEPLHLPNLNDWLNSMKKNTLNLILFRQKIDFLYITDLSHDCARSY